MTFPSVRRIVEEPEPPPPPRASEGSLRVLVVDDEEIVGSVLRDMLVSMGHRVDVASSGREAIERFGSDRFDLVMTDLAMPGMTGWEVARAIKDMAPAARVVLVSGFGVEVSAEELRSCGVDLVLAKPLRLLDLESALALARSGQAG